MVWEKHFTYRDTKKLCFVVTSTSVAKSILLGKTKNKTDGKNAASAAAPLVFRMV